MIGKKNWSIESRKKAGVLILGLIFIISSFVPGGTSSPQSKQTQNGNQVLLTNEDNKYQDNLLNDKENLENQTDYLFTEEKSPPIPLDIPQTFYQTCGYWYREPTTYAQLISWYENLEQNFSNYMEVWKANEMYGLGQIPSDNYDMYYVRIT
ncbi:MAG TPA: hypothetical protein VN377_02105, partial [Candidatus Thermoplasmatota archaeon]|nr:hypothetical protein [Candidatus Thermoplasmatota archaeon]